MAIPEERSLEEQATRAMKPPQVGAFQHLTPR
jgi:hypothetical protein